jgi:hypothetical protein
VTSYSGKPVETGSTVVLGATSAEAAVGQRFIAVVKMIKQDRRFPLTAEGCNKAMQWLQGRLGSNVELRRSESGKGWCRLSVGDRRGR